MFYTNNFFIILFVLFTILIRILPFAWRKYCLIFASLFIIASWGWASLILFVSTAIAGYVIGTIIARNFQLKVLMFAVAINLGLLILFKYRHFLFGNTLSTVIDGPLAQIGIPLGISFYTFHIISYLVDLYRGKHQSAKFFDYIFYLSFFPHVIAGPIVRGWQLVPQATQERKTLQRDILFGTHLFITGFFLKTVCADNIGAVIDPYWTASAPGLNGAEHWTVAIYYYCQLYGDFAGYSLMACGMARLLGYRLPANFRAPMRAVGFQDFWRRWHITLSRWLRDYLYVPLGGNRVGFARTSINLLIVMALGGLWHGAAWTFLVWGLIHGMGLFIERLIGAHKVTGWGIPAWWLISQAIVLIAWVFFRAPSLGFASDFVQHMFNFSAGLHVEKSLRYAVIFALPIFLHHFASPLLRLTGPSYTAPVLGSLTGLMLVTAIIVQSPPTVFIYFAF